MEMLVFAAGVLEWRGRRYRCALGRGGVSADKREGDGASPLGSFPLRRVLYRADRLAAPATGLPVAALVRNDGWCDDAADADYNRQVTLPYPARAERLWRRDGAYDLIVVPGYNDDPVVPGKGSAVFLHVAKPGYPPTQGCVAVAREELLEILEGCDAGTRLRIAP